jgi:hypothetical protein
MHVGIALYSRLWHVQTTILSANKGPGKGQLLWQLILGCWRQRTAVSVGRWPSDEISLLVFCNSFVFIGLFVWAVMWRVPNSTESTLLRGYKSQFGVGQPCRPWREWLCLAWQESGADAYPETLINTDKCGMGAFKPWRNPVLWRLWVQVMVQLMLLTCSHNFSDGFGSWLMTTWCRLYVIVSLEIVLWWGGESTRGCLRWDHTPACL